MRIAVASDGLEVAEHFSQSQNFNYYTTQSYEIVESQNLPSQSSSCDSCAEMMAKIGVDTLLCRAITPACKKSFIDRGIKVEEGASGNAFMAAAAYVERCAESVLVDEEEDDDD